MRFWPARRSARAASAAAGTSVGASLFAWSAASLPRAVVALGERRPRVGEREHRVAADADVARQHPRVHRGGQRLARARPVAGLRLEVEEGAQDGLVVGPEREGLSCASAIAASVSPSSSFRRIRPWMPTDAGAVVGQQRLVGLEGPGAVAAALRRLGGQEAGQVAAGEQRSAFCALRIAVRESPPASATSPSDSAA